jgi:hypothetical protein
MTAKSSSQQLKKILWVCDALPISCEIDKKQMVCMKKLGKYTISVTFIYTQILSAV